MDFKTLSKNEETLRKLMAKEKSPVGKLLIQQNLVSGRLVRLLAHFGHDSMEKLNKYTLGRLATATALVLPAEGKNATLVERLKEYAEVRNVMIHRLDSSVSEVNTQRELEHKAKTAKKLGNMVLGKLESTFRKYGIT